MAIRTIGQLAALVDQDDKLASELREDPAATLRKIAEQNQIPDTRVYRLVIWFLGLVALVAAVGALALAATKGGATVPDGVIALGSVALGALAGLLAPTPGQNPGSDARGRKPPPTGRRSLRLASR